MKKILIIDFGSQYTMLIARRLRELKVYCEIVNPDFDYDQHINDLSGFILSGGPASVLDETSPKLNEKILTSNLPILGICYGMQILAKSFNAQVIPCKDSRGYGNAKITITDQEILLDAITQDTNEVDVWMSHGDQVETLPEGFVSLATGTSAKVMAMANVAKKIYAMQFHPEVTHTKNGTKVLEKFLFEICQLNANWTTENIVEELITDIQETASNKKILLGLSGGVDSAVVAMLIEKASPGNLYCVLVDNGLMRSNEIKQITTAFKFLSQRLIVVDAKDKFLSQLKDITDPEAKRKIIGKVFIDVFEEEANKLGEVEFLAQGTIYPDVVESAGTGSSNTTNIKSHHNVGGLPDKLNLKLLEPLRRLFKDEVRKIGLSLGLSKDIISRHPFPGPGLAVRVIGAVDQQRLDIVRAADEIYLEELKKHDYYDKVAQAFVVLLPVASVGVQGDGRTYENVLAVRAVTTEDFMTANWAQLPNELLAIISQRIINEVVGVNRVVYDISSKPPATIEWE